MGFRVGRDVAQDGYVNLSEDGAVALASNRIVLPVREGVVKLGGVGVVVDEEGGYAPFVDRVRYAIPDFGGGPARGEAACVGLPGVGAWCWMMNGGDESLAGGGGHDRAVAVPAPFEPFAKGGADVVALEVGELLVWVVDGGEGGA